MAKGTDKIFDNTVFLNLRKSFIVWLEITFLASRAPFLSLHLTF